LIFSAANAYKSYRADRGRANSATCIVLTGDLQQVIFTPQLRNSSSFYLRKLCNYNFGLDDSSLDTSTMHLWSETIAHRGANEICSCVWSYVRSNYSVLNRGQKRELTIWTDRCSGQNNNIFLLFTLMKLARQNYFTSFNHKLFYTGHSYNSCDRDFSQVENKQRVSDILVPNDIEKVIKDSRVENVFNVKWMEQHEFLDFKNLLTYFGRPNSLKVTNFLWFHYDIETPQIILTRTTHGTVRTIWNINLLHLCLHKS